MYVIYRYVIRFQENRFKLLRGRFRRLGIWGLYINFVFLQIK